MEARLVEQDQMFHPCTYTQMYALHDNKQEESRQEYPQTTEA